ncbi:lamin tail domain-containing protein [Bacteroidota bacterium]
MIKLMPLIMALFLVVVQGLKAQSTIVINEIMYNSIGDDVEFIELYNASGFPQDLQNWYLLDDNNDHTHCVINGIIQPGEYLVIAGDAAQFQLRYPIVTQVNPNGFDTGGNGWSFGNGGDIVRLYDNTNTLHDQVVYDDGGGWPTSPDGNGPSLELLHPGLDNRLPTSWDPSVNEGGTPGAQNSVYTLNVEPTCKDGSRSIDLPSNSQAVVVTVKAFDIEGLDNVSLFVNTGQGYAEQPMNDNGLNGDAVAGDSNHTAVIPAQSGGTIVKYYAVATDNIGQQDSWPNNAPAEYHAYTVDYVPPMLRVTEILAVNNSVISDEAGEYDDWFEIHNASPNNVNLGGMFVGNSLGSSRSFELPAINLAPDEYIVFWADDDTEQGARHVDFKLSADGEAVALFETVDHGNVLIHGWKYGRMSGNVSMGFKPESGTAPEYLNSPTPGSSNETSELFSAVCINEFQATSDFGGPDDWIEIYNRGTEQFDLSGCFLSDQRSDNTKWSFPQGTIIDPGEFLVIYEDALNFGFSSEGDDVIMLCASDSTTGLDFYDFQEQQADKSEGRFPDGVNSWQLFDDPTLGTANSQTTGIEEIQSSVPIEFILHQNYPNPFNPSTTIKYGLPSESYVNISVFNIIGQRVNVLTDGVRNAGFHELRWEAAGLSSGIYFYVFHAEAISGGEKIHEVRKMMLMK